MTPRPRVTTTIEERTRRERAAQGLETPARFNGDPEHDAGLAEAYDRIARALNASAREREASA